MKTQHRARADFLRELHSLVTKLYALGDFTSSDPKRALLESKVQGYIDAGLLIEVARRDEVQNVIDECHLAAFSETRTERRERLQCDSNTDSDQRGNAHPSPDWDVYDSPAYDRKRGRIPKFNH